MPSPFTVDVAPDWEAFIACIRRSGTPRRVHHIELFLDTEVQLALGERFGLHADLDPSDPWHDLKRQIELQAFLGYDYIRCGVEGADFPLHRIEAEDTAAIARKGGRSYVDENKGPITNWAEFEAYPWPEPEEMTTRRLEWLEDNLRDDMCVVGGGGFAHFAEYLSWLMGYTTLCYALYEQRDLVQAIADKLNALFEKSTALILEFSRVKAVWGSDDMGFRGGTLISPGDMRAFVLPGHKRIAEMSHDAGRPYLLHSCGNLADIMEDLIDGVGIDAKHSFEDTIERVTELKETYGQRIALLGGIDVDFLCRAEEEAVRRRVRQTLAACQPGGGYCLGTGNSVANYLPLDNYLAMLDEGRRWTG